MRIGPNSPKSQVLKFERRLEALGYNPGAVDGKFDQDTFEAAKRWKTIHPKLTVDEAFNRIDHTAYRGRVKKTQHRKRLDALTTEQTRGPGLGLGAKGRAVSNIQ